MDRRQLLAGAGIAMLGIESAERSGAADQAPVRVRVSDQELEARCGDRPLLTYRTRTVQPPSGGSELLASSGYIHPLHAPCGAVVTNHYSPDHLHQRGVFCAWTKTQTVVDGKLLHPDFWNIQDGTGRTRSLGAEPLRIGSPHPGFRTRHVWELRSGEEWLPALDESWTVTFPAQPASDPNSAHAAFVADIRAVHTPRYTLVLPKYHYGGMAVRGSGQWPKGSDMRVLTSEGKGRDLADAAPARWIDMSGTVDGKAAGVALLEHPGNMHAPNAVRMHPDMPYFVFAIPQAGPITLPAGQSYTLLYRVVAHNGHADAARLNALWEEFSRTPF